MKLPLKILCLLILFTSCTSDDIEITNDSALAGTWKLTEWNVRTPVDLNNDGVASTNLMASEIGCLSELSNLNFSGDSEGSIYFNSDIAFYTTEENGALFFMPTCSTSDDREPSPFTYTITDNTITINSNDVFSNLSIDGNTISMQVENGFMSKDINNLEITASQDATFVFTKS